MAAKNTENKTTGSQNFTKSILLNEHMKGKGKEATFKDMVLINNIEDIEVHKDSALDALKEDNEWLTHLLLSEFDDLPNDIQQELENVQTEKERLQGKRNKKRVAVGKEHVHLCPSPAAEDTSEFDMEIEDILHIIKHDDTEDITEMVANGKLTASENLDKPVSQNDNTKGKGKEATLEDLDLQYSSTEEEEENDENTVLAAQEEVDENTALAAQEEKDDENTALAAQEEEGDENTALAAQEEEDDENTALAVQEEDDVNTALAAQEEEDDENTALVVKEEDDTKWLTHFLLTELDEMIKAMNALQKSEEKPRLVKKKLIVKKSATRNRIYKQMVVKHNQKQVVYRKEIKNIQISGTKVMRSRHWYPLPPAVGSPEYDLRMQEVLDTIKKHVKPNDIVELPDDKEDNLPVINFDISEYFRSLDSDNKLVDSEK